ncbi:hypothetical protein NEOKW01_0308 [Nematocida sp. AWRm80]|nr:hypothetical protein NEOKW01_0308 [Nematocida sp. AWRm80]
MNVIRKEPMLSQKGNEEIIKHLSSLDKLVLCAFLEEGEDIQAAISYIFYNIRNTILAYQKNIKLVIYCKTRCSPPYTCKCSSFQLFSVVTVKNLPSLDHTKIEKIQLLANSCLL